MIEVTGLLHGPDLPASGVPTQLQFRGDFLRVTRADGTLEDIAAQSLDVSVTGFNEDTLQLSWERAGHTHAVTVSDPSATRALVESAPAGFAPKLARGHSTVNYHRRKWNSVIGVLAGLALLVLVGWWQSDRITAWIAGRVSMETEVSIGERALAQLEREHELTQDGVAAKAIADIGARLTKGSKYEYRWYLSDDEEVNAYALPGGIVVVNKGMIDEVENAEELAGVLAHEVQHIEHRHTLQQMIASAGWAATLAVVLGDVSAITAIVIHQLGNLRNSRKLEAEADTEGMKALARAGIPLDGMATLFRRLQADEKKRGGEGPALLSSHPATEERIADLEQLAVTLRCDCRPLGIDWSAVRAAAAK
ncbi:MAG TPA: M48 family metallopeptidase [Steroidobacteraceae bacterium]|nr:M48 family metallopeptidase [Steroidobacteraceae bacterium]